MARVYISSTFSDLEEHRRTVGSALRRLGHEDVAMEYYVAEDKRPLDRCLSDVESCDVYVGIFAWRYGYIPNVNYPDGRSITELEYRKAREKGVPRLIFLLSEDALWPRSKQDKGAAADKIETLRQELASGHLVNMFESPDELARKVNEAIIAWEKKSGLVGKRQLTDWDAYRQAVYDKHQWVRLQVIAGASKERGVARIPLTEVFQPHLVAQGVSEADVPDEVLEYQKKIFGRTVEEPQTVPPLENGQTEVSEETVEPELEEPLLSSNPELVLDVLGRESTQVVLGGPGSGKSTVLHYAMLRVSQAGATSEVLPVHLQNAPVPFLVELRNYVLLRVPDFLNYIISHSKDFYGAAIDTESLAIILAQAGRTLVFFDGLDEVFDPDERRRVIDQFQTFARRYPTASIVVTSRIAGYDRTALGLAGFEHYTLLPLTLGHVRHFAEKWYQYYTLEGTERTAQGLVQRIVENPRLLDLAGNPLLLTMMAVIYKDRDLPNERWRLYERCAETLLEDWDLGKGFEDEDFKLAVLVKTAQKSEILQRVSMYMLEHNQKDRELNAVAYAPLLDILATYLEEKYQRSRGDAEAVAVDILRHLMERTYVLASIGERVFGFVHRTFMEYFAACRCQALFNARKSDFSWLSHDIFGENWQKPEWEEVLLLLIAMLHDQDTPIRDVVEHLRSQCRTQVPFNIAFAAHCLGEAGDVQDQEHGKALLVELAQAIAEYASRRGKQTQPFVEAALKGFAALAPMVAAPSEVQEAIERLNQTKGLAARMAAWQMGFALRSRRERLNYAVAALQDEEEVVRRGAISALEREWPGRADIVPILTEVVRNDRIGRVGQAALAAMQRSWPNDPIVLDAIAARADEESAHTHVNWLIEYFVKTWPGNAKAFDVMVKLADRKPKAGSEYDYVAVTSTVHRALVKAWANYPRTLSFLRDELMIHMRAGNVSHVGRIVAEWGGNPQAQGILEDLVKSDPGASSRAIGLASIGYGWPGDPQALAFLQEQARNDPEPSAHEAALQGIANGWRDDPQALDFLQEQARKDADPATRVAALRALMGVQRGPQFFSLFLRFPPEDTRRVLFVRDCGLRDPAAEVRACVVSLFSGLLPRPTMQRNFHRRVSQSDEIKDIAISFLRNRAANDPDEQIRVSALDAIPVFTKSR
jgi:hypothetical protein